MARLPLIVAGLLVFLPLFAQVDPDFSLSEYSFSSSQDAQLASTDFRITLVSLSAEPTGTRLSNSFFVLDGGFGTSYPPPGEVRGVRFIDTHTLEWNPERSVGQYSLYRDVMSNLAVPVPNYGSCEQWDLSQNTTTDPALPPSGDGYIYLVTAENLLAEEGTKGHDSTGLERPNLNPCP